MSKNIKPDAKEVVLPHSQAKLDLYKNYLLHYFKVLSLTPYCSKINLFDIYCGIGVYSDGNIGSPLITQNCIKEINAVLKKLNKPLKPTSININDYKKDKIENVKRILNADKIENCTYDYYNKNADEMLILASDKVNSYKKSERNLIFIDPYGYSDIHRDKIYNLLKNEHTEILMFLPVMQMYRFKDIALTDPDRSCYEDLRRFIFSFFPSRHKIHKDAIEDVFEFIKEIREAFSFEHQFYTCSHYIERGKGNYYALFFITSNIYGLDKMVEAKWKLDPIKGKGFSQSKSTPQISMFTDHFELEDSKRYISFLKKLILEKLRIEEKITNNDIYELSLQNEFKPSHAKMVLEELLGKEIRAFDLNNEESNPTAFYMDYTHFKNKTIKIYYKLNGTI